MGAEPERLKYNVQLQGKSAQRVNRFLKSLKLNLCETVTNECIIFIKKWCSRGLHKGWPVAEANLATAKSSASWRLPPTKPFSFFYCLIGCVFKTASKDSNVKTSTALNNVHLHMSSETEYLQIDLITGKIDIYHRFSSHRLLRLYIVHVYKQDSRYCKDCKTSVCWSTHLHWNPFTPWRKSFIFLHFYCKVHQIDALNFKNVQNLQCDLTPPEGLKFSEHNTPRMSLNNSYWLDFYK